MSSAWILPNKLTPPVPARDWLRRDLALMRGAPTTFLVAGPGYGKSAVLAALVAEAEATGQPTLWYSLDAYDAEPATFFHYMVAGMQRHIPEFGLAVHAALQSGQTDPAGLWRSFFQELASFNSPALLALDDAHLLESRPELLKALGYWLDKLPAGVRVAIATRKRLPLATSRLELKGAVRVLGPGQLRFSNAEVETLMTHRAAEGVPEAWRVAASGLDGWPLGLDMLTSTGDSGSAPLSRYIAEELFEVQPPARQRFMLQAALLAELSAESCQQALELTDAPMHLAALESDHLVQALQGGTHFRFPAYLREFLLQEGERAASAAERAGWHASAAAYHQARRQPEQALPHWVAALNWSAALAACAEAFPAMRHGGRLATVERWLSVFPTEVAASDPTWLLWQGHTHLRAGRHAEASEAYARARLGFEAAYDEVGQFKVLVQQANLALLQEDLPRFGALVMQALARQAIGLPEDQADLLLVRALSAEQRGDMALMRECNEGVMAIAIDGNVELAASHAIAATNLYTHAQHQGELVRAHAAIDRVVAIAEAYGFVAYSLFAAFLKAHLHLQEGDAEAAGALLKALPTAWPKLLDWHSLGCAYTVLGFWHQLKGAWKEADEALQRSLAIFEKAGFKEGLKLPLERLAWFAIQRGHTERVPGLLARAGLETIDATAPTRNVYDLALRLPEARALHLAGDPAGALALLGLIAPAAEAIEARLQLARLRLYEAAARLATGDSAGARQALASARELAHRHGFAFLFSQDQVLWRELAALTPAPDNPASPSSTGAPPLSLHVFGGLEVRLGGVLVDRWPRRKSTLILSALLLHPKGLRQGDLADILGPGTEEATPSTVKVAVLNLRRTLEPALDKGEASAYVRLVGDRYVLDWSQVADLDLTAFGEAADAGDHARHSDPPAALAAYSHALTRYRDNLLVDPYFLGFFEAERDRLRDRAMAMLSWVAEFQSGRGDVAAADAALQRAVSLAPCDEAAAIALMRHYQGSHRPERVKQVYWDYCRAAKALLGASPSEDFTATFQAVGRA